MQEHHARNQPFILTKQLPSVMNSECRMDIRVFETWDARGAYKTYAMRPKRPARAAPERVATWLPFDAEIGLWDVVAPADVVVATPVPIGV